MLRRRALISSLGKSPSETWDIDWKYTDGELTNFGFEKTASGGGSSQMKGDGLHLYANYSAGYVAYVAPVKTSVYCVAEYEVNIAKKAFGGNGLRLILSNGKTGAQVFGVQGHFIVSEMNESPNNGLKVFDFVENVDYLVRIEYDENIGNKVFINGSKVYEGNKFSTYYIATNKIFQQNSGETVLKGLRYRFSK